MDTKQALQHIRFAIVLLLNLWWFSLDPLLNSLWLLELVFKNRGVFKLSVCKSSCIALFCNFWSSKRSCHVQQFRNHVFGHISIWLGFRFEANGFWQHVTDCLFSTVVENITFLFLGIFSSLLLTLRLATLPPLRGCCVITLLFVNGSYSFSFSKGDVGAVSKSSSILLMSCCSTLKQCCPEWSWRRFLITVFWDLQLSGRTDASAGYFSSCLTLFGRADVV